MGDFSMPDDEFERLYAEELEIMNELKTQEPLDDQAFEEHVDSIKETSIKELKEVPAEQILIKDSSHKENYHCIGNWEESSLNFTNTDPSSVKKRLLDDTSYEANQQYMKKRKFSLPKVGYEIEIDSKIDPDVETIDRILSYRSMLQTNEFKSVLSSNEMKPVKRKCRFHRHIPDGDFQSVTGESGKRIYLEVEEEKSFEASVEKVGEIKDNINLLSVPYRDLRMEAEKELLSLNTQILSPNEDANTSNSNVKPPISDDCELWVNKYRPKSYLDLLSDESTNRTVLHWMKLWDKIVFGITSKSKIKEKSKDKSKFISKFAPEVLEDLDEIGRPQQKAVLLCGPPGLGKTTLAHIIAKHAGYNVVEMNASDDRSVEFFRTNLENATTMRSVFGSNKLPNCLIIDEIDGAPAPSINFLVNLLQAKQTKTDTLKNKKKNNFSLLRPVICICNDLYTPSLRPLRQISLVIQFPPTQSTRLAQRLYSISRMQRMRADLSVLLALCKKTENDIRACLSVLQFVRVSSGELKFLDLEGVTVGQKDYQRSLFSVWHNIFTVPRAKRNYGVNPHQKKVTGNSLLDEMTPNASLREKSDPSAMSSRFNNILKTAQCCGEFDKLTLGWFENYLTMKFKHTHLEPVVEGLDWAIMTDIFQKEILRSQSWNLGSYIPLSFVAFHFLFASHNWPKLQFPNQYNEVRYVVFL